jgi:hypothetical protein
MIVQALLLNLLMMAAIPAEIQVVSFPPRGKVAVSIGPKGKADVERLGTVTKVSLQLEGLPTPPAAFAGMNAFVAWVVSPEGSFENLGELEMEGAKASLEATTRFDRFGVLITAEPHYMVDRPSAAIMLQNDRPRVGRSVPLSIHVGEYEYRNLPSPATNVPALVLQARAAMAIAQAAQAERLAEADFRQARISLDTAEELVRRVSPIDAIAPSAHEAIRRAQRAVTISRQSVR